ncbi:hypothetical protein [Runella sp. CRIBMP]|uniref:hypothetical protein n=1 Tax=Runella sp. CRIBMP TaxID=2683261 RepID=UPI001981C90A|nr:hypothetical protein [Runella sp. CRIBMP]
MISQNAPLLPYGNRQHTHQHFIPCPCYTTILLSKKIGWYLSCPSNVFFYQSIANPQNQIIWIKERLDKTQNASFIPPILSLKKIFFKKSTPEIQNFSIALLGQKAQIIQFLLFL